MENILLPSEGRLAKY